MSARKRMIATIEAETKYTRHLTGRDSLDSCVIDAMREVPRDAFVPPGVKAFAYNDSPLSIGHGQTISQPFIVALMTDLLDPQADDVVLEVGTGCGYQAAILSQLVRQVYSVEVIEALATEAAETLRRLAYYNVQVKVGDGAQGWLEHAPYDGIIVTAAAPFVPQPLIDQLKPHARLVIPVGQPHMSQSLLLIEKDGDGKISTRDVLEVAFVPLKSDNETEEYREAL